VVLLPCCPIPDDEGLEEIPIALPEEEGLDLLTSAFWAGVLVLVVTASA